MRPASTRSCCPNADCEDAAIRRRRVVMTSRWSMGRHVVRNNHAATTSMHPRCLGKGAICLYRLNGTALAISKSSCHSQLRYSAPTPALYKTVADIRKKLAEDDYAGERDPSKNFTGFWKEDCDQAFGLQIMPHGTDGKYSIVFCGPVDVETQITKGALRSSQKTETTKSSATAKLKSVVPMVGTPTTDVRKIPIRF
jgi:hypothetical protein